MGVVVDPPSGGVVLVTGGTVPASMVIIGAADPASVVTAGAADPASASTGVWTEAPPSVAGGGAVVLVPASVANPSVENPKRSANIR